MLESIFSWFGYLVACYLAADFLAGAWHWIEDRYFGDRWPIVGRWIPKTNDAHHDKPQAFLNQSYVSRNGYAIAAALIAIAATDPTWWPVWIFASQANEAHAFAHRKGTLSPLVVMLQEVGLLQSPRHHGVHHRAPHLVRYCVMSNWLNPILDLVDFWRRSEALLSSIGIHPRE